MNHLYYLYGGTALAVLVSFIANQEKTVKAVKIGVKKLLKILPAFITMLIIVSIVLFVASDSVISNYLGHDNQFYAMLFASFFGSVTLMPGFISFPLCGILIKKGVAYMVLSAFTTTLMMVGVLTYPIEKEYFGTKVTIIRNMIGFFIAIVIAVITGVFYGEM